MATQKIDIGVNVSDNGSTSKMIKSVETLHAKLKAAQDTAEKLAVGGTSGSRGVAAKAQPSGSQIMTDQSYGTARGSAGLTGASARDFAAQSQGLGGLVRLYATYAANIFAVGAAFRALSEAADTSNMVRGLDALGAASGKSLGSLSKQLVSVTDGAISLREAMSATAMASSAGMSGEAIRRMGAVAKTASLALGVSMPDAISRLSRGITKLEPELLDELGLFTKIGPATEKYATEVGKTVSQLTDFERRQAFANAVLDEGEKKFKALGEASANPYDKLLAQLKNVSQTGLSVVNKVLEPIVNLLSQSPTALATGLLAVGGILIKQALPALGEFKQGLRAAADRDLKAAQGRAGDALAARDQLNKLVEAKVESAANKELQKFEDLEAKLYSVRESGVRKRGALYKILEKDLVDISDKEIKAAEKSVKALEGKAKTDPKLQPVAQLERQGLEQLKSTIAAEEELVALKLKNKQAIKDELDNSSTLASVQKKALDYERDAKKSALVSNAAYNSSLLGIGNAWKLFKLEVEATNLKLSWTEKLFLMIRGGAASLTGVVTELGSALNKAFMVLTIVQGLFAVIDAMFSTNAKESQRFSDAMDAAKDSVSNAKRTMDALKSESGFDKNTIDSIFALSNAFNELADSAKSAYKTANELKAASSGFDKSWNWLLGFVNLDIDSKLSKTISSQIKSASELLAKEGLDEEFNNSIKKILNIENFSDVAYAFEHATDTARQAVIKLLDVSKNTLGKPSTELQKFKESSDAAYKSYKEFLQSTLDTSPLFKLGESFVNMAISMQTFADSAGSVDKALAFLMENPEKAAMFGKDFVISFAEIGSEFVKQKAEVDANTRAINYYNKQLQDTLELKASIESVNTAGEGEVPTVTLDNQITKLQDAISTLKATRLTINTKALDKGSELFAQAIESSMKKGMDYASKALKDAQVAAGAAIAKASAGALSGERKIQEEADIQRKQLSAQLELVNTTQDLINVQDQLVAEMRLANALAQHAADKTDKSAGEVDFAKAMANLARTGVAETVARLTPAQQEQVSAKAKLTEIRNMQQEAQRTKIGGEMQALNISTDMAARRARIQEEIDLANAVSAVTKLYSERLNIIQSISGVTTKETLTQQSLIELAQLENKNRLELQKIDLDIQLAQERANASTGKSKERYLAEVVVLKQKKDYVQATQSLELDNRGLQDRQKLLQVELDDITKRYELLRSTADLDKSVAIAELDTQSQILNLRSTAYGLDKDILAQRQHDLDTQKALLDYTYAIDSAQSALNQKREDAEARIKELRNAGRTDQSPEIVKINAELARQESLTANIISKEKAQLDSKKLILEEQKAINIEQAKYDELLNTATSMGENLKAVFGELGTSISDAAQAFAKLTIASEKNAKIQLDLENELIKAKKSNDPKAIAAAEKSLAKQKRVGLEAELDGISETASATKKMFNEKSTGYKLMSAVEKSTAAVSMALKVQDMAVNIATLPAKIAGGVAQLFSQGGWAGFAGAAAFLALMSSLGSSSSASATSFTPDAKQKQEVQGTGSAWDAQGNKVETGGGVFGDSSAKLDSINKGIQTIKDNSIDGLFYDNRMLKALETIAASITGAAQSLYSTPGIRSGLNFGTMPGTTLDTNWYQDIPLIGGVLGSIFGGGTSASSSIQDAGIQIKGSLQDLADGVYGTVKQYKDILTQFKEDGGWFGSDDYWTELRRETNSVTTEIRQAFSDIFKDSKNLFTQVADLAGISSARVNEVFSSLALSTDISLKGLTGEEQLKELNAVISAQLDIAAKELFSGFDKFKKFGEGYTDTVIRVVDGNNKVNTALKAMGSTFDVTKDMVEEVSNSVKLFGGSLTLIFDRVVSKFEISETIINKMAGSLDKFTEQAQFFIDNFLTESEKINISRKGVSEALSALYLSTDLSREEFKALVRMQDLSTQTGRDMYQGLMDIQEAFFKVTQRIEDLKSQTKSLEIELLKAQGRTSEAAAAVRAMATEGMTEAELQVYNYNESLQAQIDLLKQVDTVSKERASLEQRLFQLGNDTVALRALELDKLDESNKKLQLQIWTVEDYTKVLNNAKAAIDKASQSISSLESTLLGIQSKATDNYVTATEKVANAQQAIANIAIEAAKKMRDFGKSLREFVSAQLLPKSGSSDISKVFTSTVKSAMSGDATAMEKLPEIAQQAIDSAKATAQSSREFNSIRATILSKVTDVAKYAELQASLGNIPAEEDPLVAANKALEDALKEQTDALNVANALGASLVKLPEDLIQQYKLANEDLASAILQKTYAEEAQKRAQAALDGIVSNTGKLIQAITGVDTETSEMSQKVQEALYSGFSGLDTNLDGKLTFDELKLGLAGKATDEEIMNLIKSTDLNADGIIDSYELQTSKSTYGLVSSLTNGFNLLDTNLDGKLTFDELKLGLAGKATDEEIMNLIKSTDLNADGIIDSYEAESTKSTTSLISSLTNGFKLLDTNLDGKLTFDELKSGLAGKATDAQIKSLMDAADLNADGIIDSYEAESTKSTTSLISSLTNGFNLLDTNLDGKVTSVELKNWLNGKATDAQIKSLMDAADLNADNIIEGYELELLNSTTSIVGALYEGFSKLDTNLDGKVSSSEFFAGMSGKASDKALESIFKLIDADNDKLISKSEITAANSVLTATYSNSTAIHTSGISTNTASTIDAIGISAKGLDAANQQTLNALTNLNNANLQVISNNTAVTVQGINKLLDNNVALFNAMNAVALNTKSLADSVKAGSGTTGGGSASSGGFTGLIGKVIGAVGSVVGGVVNAIGSLAKKVFSFFSDKRVKTNITLHERLANGIALYDFNYKAPYSEIYGSDRKRGVIAQEVKDRYPDAVSLSNNGMYMVDYSKLPIPSDKLKFALGGVFGASSVKSYLNSSFAGAFTNSIVTRPTNFPIGLMGEAGPEAIMPLTRAADGSLGVVSKPSTDTSFNNSLLAQNQKLTEEIKSLKDEVSMLRHEARATAVASTKTTRILQRVTQNGESLLTTAVA